MALALFDLDNTLLQGDSDHAWCEFLIEEGVLDGNVYREQNEKFYADYRAGTLDIHAFLDFQLAPLASLPMEHLHALHQRFMSGCIQPLITPAARALVEAHRRRGDDLVVITATNSFVTRPIAEAFGIPTLIATEPECRDGRYTGKLADLPCFREGKVTRLQAWLQKTGHQLADSTFYSDSHNDLPLLQAVHYPVAVNPDAVLRQHACQAGWPILDLSGDVVRQEKRQPRCEA